jgi:hypothetical protein
VAAVYSDLMLDRLRQEVPELAEAATRGKEIEWRRNDPPVHGPAERYFARLYREQPAIALLRAGCGEERCARFAETEALRAEVQRLRELVLEAARRFEEAGHPHAVSRLRKAVDTETDTRSR